MLRSIFPALRKIIGVAASHHRLLWIHPFIDGNGRVTRLLSHALLRELDVGSELWSVSRGLARRVAEYKSSLQAADEPRRGDLDGRGNLTLAVLWISAGSSWQPASTRSTHGRTAGPIRTASTDGDLGPRKKPAQNVSRAAHGPFTSRSCHERRVLPEAARPNSQAMKTRRRDQISRIDQRIETVLA